MGKPQGARFGGLQGLRVDADLVVDATGLSYRYWIHPRAGHSTPLVVWGPRARREALGAEAGKRFRRFSVPDPKEREEPDEFRARRA